MSNQSDVVSQLQAIIDRSAASAGPSIARNFIGGGWAMDAREFVAFWGGTRMAVVSTVSAKGVVHAVPLEVGFRDGVFHAPAFSDSVRLGDHIANARCVITAYNDAYTAAIVYGEAAVAGTAASMTDITITPTRIYAIRRPSGARPH